MWQLWHTSESDRRMDSSSHRPRNGKYHILFNCYHQTGLLQCSVIWHHWQNILWLQRVQNSLAPVVCVASFRSPAASLLRSLHWLPIRHRITHKVATLTSKALDYCQPTYLYQLLNIYSPACQLSPSGAGLLVKPETSNKTSDRAVAVAAATTWNRQNSYHHWTVFPCSKRSSVHSGLNLVAHSNASDSLFQLINYGAL